MDAKASTLDSPKSLHSLVSSYRRFVPIVDIQTVPLGMASTSRQGSALEAENTSNLHEVSQKDDFSRADLIALVDMGRFLLPCFALTEIF